MIFLLVSSVLRRLEYCCICVMRTIQSLCAVSCLRGLLDRSYNQMLLMMGICCCTFPLCLLCFHLIHLTVLSLSNFLRIIRPSCALGLWKTSLQIARSTSRYWSQRTSFMSNLQVGREWEIKYTGCDLCCQQKERVCLVLLRLLFLIILGCRNNGMESFDRCFWADWDWNCWGFFFFSPASVKDGWVGKLLCYTIKVLL